jgi:predicted RNA polymerase sigma factor
VTLNRAVAVAMVHGPAAGLDLLASLDETELATARYRVAGVRAHLRELAGDRRQAAADYAAAARRATSLPERRYLQARADQLADSFGRDADAGRPPQRSA